jgi:hypothetical protein
MKKMRMMSFKQFIAEEQDDHSNGTYINVKPTDVDKDNLYNWVVLNKISNPLDKHEYHVTVIYSKTPCPDAKEYDFNLPIHGDIVGWKIFDAPIGRCLVAHVHSDQLQKINADLKRDYGATSDYPDYIAHITVSYDYVGELPTDYPAMSITFNEVQVKGLDPTWRPKKENEDGNN